MRSFSGRPSIHSSGRFSSLEWVVSLVEVFKDSAVGLPPLNANLARKMLEETKLYKALLGVRGMKSVNIEALIQIMVRFSVLIVDLPEILECDINPLIASEDSILSLDARVVLHDPKTAPEDWPQPAIRPYPHQYVQIVGLTDEMSVTRPTSSSLVCKSLSQVYYRITLC